MYTQLKKICKKHNITPRVAEHAVIHDHMTKNNLHGNLVTITVNLPAKTLKLLAQKAKALKVDIDSLLTGVLLASMDKPKEFDAYVKKMIPTGWRYSKKEDRKAYREGR